MDPYSSTSFRVFDRVLCDSSTHLSSAVCPFPARSIAMDAVVLKESEYLAQNGVARGQDVIKYLKMWRN